jgi:hypothetical protein
MREFFRGWRRKVGCVTLMMACVAMPGWTRDRVVHHDVVTRSIIGHRHVVASFSGHVVWWTWNESDIRDISEPTIWSDFEETWPLESSGHTCLKDRLQISTGIIPSPIGRSFGH